MSPEQQRRRLLATLVEWVLGAARVQPTVIATEDLHWADPSTLELIELLVEQGATAPLLLLYTARPEFRAQWPPRTHHAQITLDRLNKRIVRTMVDTISSASRVVRGNHWGGGGTDRRGAVVRRENDRGVLESGKTELLGREIPETLHDSLMARLDRLGGAKQVAQIGAASGASFLTSFYTPSIQDLKTNCAWL